MPWPAPKRMHPSFHFFQVKVSRVNPLFFFFFIKLIDGEVLSHYGFVEKSGIQSTESSQLPLLSTPLASPTILHGCGTCVMIKKLVLIHYY